MNRAMCQIFGTATVELIGAWPERCLSRFAALRLPMDQVEKVDELTCRVRLLQRDLKRAEAVASKCGCEFRILAARRPADQIWRTEAQGGTLCGDWPSF